MSWLFKCESVAWSLMKSELISEPAESGKQWPPMERMLCEEACGVASLHLSSGTRKPSPNSKSFLKLKHLQSTLKSRGKWMISPWYLGSQDFPPRYYYLYTACELYILLHDLFIYSRLFTFTKFFSNTYIAVKKEYGEKFPMKFLVIC